MTLDEAEKLAGEHVSPSPCYDIGKRDLARFVLAVLPVVRAAEAWRDETCQHMPDCDAREGRHDFACEVDRNDRALWESVDAMRTALTRGGGEE